MIDFFLYFYKKVEQAAMAVCSTFIFAERRRGTGKLRFLLETSIHFRSEAPGCLITGTAPAEHNQR